MAPLLLHMYLSNVNELWAFKQPHHLVIIIRGCSSPLVSGSGPAHYSEFIYWHPTLQLHLLSSGSVGLGTTTGGGKTLFGDYTAHTWWLPSTSSSHLLNNKTHDGDGPRHIITYILMATTPRRHLLLVHHYRSDGVHVHKQWG